MKAKILRRSAEIILPVSGFLPEGVLALRFFGLIKAGFLFRLSIFALLPAFSLSALAKSFWGMDASVAVFVLGAITWSGFLAYVVYRFTRLFTADDFDWSGFWGGLVLGFVPGLLAGWRLWITFYKVASLTTCLILGGLAVGFGLGVYMGGCWSKAK